MGGREGRQSYNLVLIDSTNHLFSGKSSLVSTLFRILDLDSGSIWIDGVDLATISRQEIRSRLIAVPQEPYLFDGSVRLNVNPSGDVADEAIETALKKVQLWHVINDSGGLSARVTKDFFSHGQKQLLCIAGAMLRKGNILVLDEVTSRQVFSNLAMF